MIFKEKYNRAAFLFSENWKYLFFDFDKTGFIKEILNESKKTFRP